MEYIVYSHAEVVLIYRCEAEIPELEDLAVEVRREANNTDSRTGAGENDV